MRYYGISPATLRAGEYTVIDLAELVDALPDGCAYKLEVGGYWALTNDQKFYAAQEYQLRVANWMDSKDGASGKNPPRPMEAPKGRYQEQQEALEKEAKYANKIAQFEAMEARRQAAFKEQEENNDALQESEN